MNVLIVDDELIARIGLINAIDWSSQGCSIAGETGDSAEALQLARDRKPDVAIVDIVMPGMDGLELIRRIREINPFCRFVIVSCMDDRPYYKQALELGVSGYINKATFRPEDLQALLQKIARELNTSRVITESFEETDYINRYSILASFLVLELRKDNNNSQGVENKLKAFGFTPGDGYRLLAMDLRLSGVLGEEYIRRSAVVVSSEILNSYGNGFVFELEDGLVTILLCGATAAEEKLRNICYRLSNTLSQYFDLSVAIGASPQMTGYTRMRSTYLLAKEALSMEFFERQLFQQAPRGGVLPVGPKVRACREKLQTARLETPADELVGWIDNLRDAIRTERYYHMDACKRLYLSFLYHYYNLLYARPELEGVLTAQMDPIRVVSQSRDLDDLTARTADFVRTVAEDIRERSSANKLLINRVKAYVIQNLGDRLLVEEIAKEVFVSPAYLGRVFKKETGNSLRQFVMNAKLEEAKKLLLQYRDVAKVSETLNFSSTSHFIRIFKQQEGKTPKQYITSLTKL